jgi:lysophospholipase L1-like esterase
MRRLKGVARKEKIMRRLINALLAINLVLAAAPAIAATEDGPVYLALGNSIAFGEGADRPEQHGYVPVLYRNLREVDCFEDGSSGCPHLELVNLAVPGAKSSDLIATQLQPALTLISQRNGDTDPGNDVEFITIDIGGNDLFAPVTTQCSAGVTPACAATIQSVFATYANNLGQILGSLRSVAGLETEIAVMTYYNPLGACHLAGLAPLADVVLEGGGPLAVGFNDLIRAVAADTGVQVADTFGRLALDDYVGGTDCLHPVKSGHRKIAKVFAEVIG